MLALLLLLVLLLLLLLLARSSLTVPVLRARFVQGKAEGKDWGWIGLLTGMEGVFTLFRPLYCSRQKDWRSPAPLFVYMCLCPPPPPPSPPRHCDACGAAEVVAVHCADGEYCCRDRGFQTLHGRGGGESRVQFQAPVYSMQTDGAITNQRTRSANGAHDVVLAF
ncbi:hypothetical protein BC567DRAFT_204995 [Phyllosticta citribraziliensis]